MNYASFVWPDEDAEVDRLLVSAYLNAIASLSMKVGPRLEGAIAIARTVVAGNPDVREREAALEACWDWLRVGARIGDMRSREALETRLAISLLNVRPPLAEERLDCLSWFEQVIGLLREDVAAAQKALDDSFFAYDLKRRQEASKI